MSNLIKERISGREGSYLIYRYMPKQKVHIEEIGSDESKSEKSRFFALMELICQIVSKVLDEKLQLSATVWADSRSHIFFLKMGFVPDDFPFSYAAWKYEEEGYRALKALKDSQLKFCHLKVLKNILLEEDRGAVFEDSGGIREQAILLDVLNRKNSFLKDLFFPAFLNLISSTNSFQEFPVSKSLRTINMTLTEKGFQRWQNTLDRKIPFVPFSDFSHITPLMSDEQQKMLY